MKVREVREGKECVPRWSRLAPRSLPSSLWPGLEDVVET